MRNFSRRQRAIESPSSPSSACRRIAAHLSVERVTKPAASAPRLIQSAGTRERAVAWQGSDTGRRKWAPGMVVYVCYLWSLAIWEDVVRRPQSARHCPAAVAGRVAAANWQNARLDGRAHRGPQRNELRWTSHPAGASLRSPLAMGQTRALTPAGDRKTSRKFP